MSQPWFAVVVVQLLSNACGTGSSCSSKTAMMQLPEIFGGGKRQFNMPRKVHSWQFFVSIPHHPNPVFPPMGREKPRPPAPNSARMMRDSDLKPVVLPVWRLPASANS
jgi:hypothetical protein